MNGARPFTPERADGGYDNEAAATQTVSGDAWVRYQHAAEEVAKRVTADAALDDLGDSSLPKGQVDVMRA